MYDSDKSSKVSTGMHRRLLVLVLLLAAPACTPGGAGAETATQAATGSDFAPASARIPTPAYLPPACVGVGLATVEPAIALGPTAAPSANRLISTDDQLDVLGGLENAVRDNYLYRDFNGLDWTGAVAAVRSSVEAGMDTEGFYQELRLLTHRLGDEHSYFQSPAEIAAEEAERLGHLNFVGIGTLLQAREDKGFVTVLAVFPDSPADHAGLRAHDRILAVDGIPTVEDGVPRQQLTRGPGCTLAVLTVQTPGETARQVSVVREAVSGSLPIDARLLPTSDGSRIGYLFLPTFLDETLSSRVEQALEAFGPLDGLILDNRVNGGGLGSVAEAMLAFFAAGPMGYYVDSQGESLLMIEPHPVHNSQTVPLAILIGEDTVSYAEVFSGVLQDVARATLIGQGTGGNVEQLRAFDFSDGSRVWLAAARFDPPVSGADWEASGIEPDVLVDAAWEDFPVENDPVVAAGLELLGGK